jgi:hypothetical protein
MGKSLCLNANMGRPGKHFANQLYERKGQNQQPVKGKTTSRELLVRRKRFADGQDYRLPSNL